MNKLLSIKSFIKKYNYVFIMIIPFLLMDLFIRYEARNISYFRSEYIISNILFNVMWIGLIVSISLCLGGLIGKIFYGIFFSAFSAFFLTHCIYYEMTGFFFNFNLIFSASEGSAYILDTILGTDIHVYVLFLILVISAVFAIKSIPKTSCIRYVNIITTFLLFIVMQIIAPLFMGSANSGLQWDTWRNPRDVYNNFNDSNKNIKICGLFQYTFRDFYITFMKSSDEEDADELQFLDNEYKNLTTHEHNDYTGIFEGKNIILLQLEGIDDWLLTEETMPNLYNLMSNSINFTNHYSYYNGGGSTFNSELAVNTGFITPISYTRNAYSFTANCFDYSIANTFKNMGYTANAFHMNTEEYYQRGINYKNWGYDNYYGLIDISTYNDLAYELDRELIENDKMYQLMFNSDTEKFLYSIITYTPHTPFTTEKGIGQYLANILYGDNVPDMSEEDVAKMFAGETDTFVGLLIDALQKNNLLDNIVIVVYADHYLYTLSDKSILDKYKETDTNLINHTPFFIWSSDTTYTPIEKVNSQIDILPTVLNLFGVDYTPEFYIGNDIMDNSYSGYAFFSDYSWYDGAIYVEDGVKIKGQGVIDVQSINEMNSIINNIIQKNDLTLKYDYLRRLK